MILIDFVYTEHHQFVAMYRHGAGGHGGCGMLWPPGTKRRDRSVDPVTDVWYIYLQNWVIYRVNVGKYTIHGSSGYGSHVLYMVGKTING